MTGLMSLDLKSGALSYVDFGAVVGVDFLDGVEPDKSWRKWVYSTLTSIDVANHSAGQAGVTGSHVLLGECVVGRHAVYTGGTNCDVGFYDAANLEKKAILKLPGCSDQTLSTLRVIHDR